MGFLNDVEELFGVGLGDLLDDAGDVKIEIVSKKDIDKRLSELEAEGYKLTEDSKRVVREATREEPKDDLDDELEYYRKEALKERNELVKKYGEEKVRKITDLALHVAMINSLLSKEVPLDQSIVDEYNALCREVNPDHCDDFILNIIYMLVRHTAEKGLKELG